MKRICLAGCLMLLQGCTSLAVMSHVPVSTMTRLSALGPSDIDPALLRVAIRMPGQIAPRPSGTRVLLEIKAASSRKYTFTLQPVTDGRERAALPIAPGNDSQTWLFRLKDEDMRMLQLELHRANISTDAAGVTISASVDACHTGAFPDGPLPTTTWLRTNSSGYFALAEDLDMRRIVSASELRAKVPPCPPH